MTRFELIKDGEVYTFSLSKDAEAVCNAMRGLVRNLNIDPCRVALESTLEDIDPTLRTGDYQVYMVIESKMNEW